MSAFPGPFNPIVYAQFNIQGRWRRMLAIMLGYTVVIGSAMWVTAVTANHAKSSFEAWTGLLCGLQILVLLLFGAFRVESAVRTDVISRMLESHRLMPAPPLGSILGYILGAPLQPFLLFVANFLLGIIACSQSGLGLDNWALTNGVLFCFSLFVYAMIVQLAFVARGGFLLLLIVGIVCVVFASNEALAFLPAVGALLSPLLSQKAVFAVLFNSTRGSNQYAFQYTIALAAQAVFALIAIRVAVRRYLYINAVGITARLGLMMLFVWVALCVVQYQWPSSFYYSYYRYSQNDNDIVAQTVLGFASALLLSLIPIGSAAWTARNPADHTPYSMPNRWASRAEIFTTLGTVAITCGLFLGIPFRYAGMSPTHQWTTSNRVIMLNACGLTLVIVLNFLLSMAFLFSWGYRIRRRAWIFVCIWILLSWAIPIALDGIYRSVVNDPGSATVITAFSPPGAMALIWSHSDISVLPGILGQALLGVVPTLLLLVIRPSRKS